MSPEFEAAFVRHAALSFDKQLNLANVIGNRSWGVDMNSGKLTFGKQGLFDRALEFDIQVLGTAAEGSSTWLWSWANESVPDNLSRASIFLREKGDLPEFSTPEFALDFAEADEHRVAMTSAGVLAQLFGCDAYYRGPYEGGAAFFLLRDPRLHIAAPDLIHISMMFPQLISALKIPDQRTAFLSYLEQWQISSQVEGDEVRVAIANSSLTAHFDSQNRLADIQVNARP